MPAKSLRKEESRSPWGLEEIRGILDLLSERGISEFEMEKDGFRVRIKRGAASEGGQLSSAIVVDETAPESKLRLTPATASSSSAPAATGEKVADLHVIKSPIVGTFYAAPKP